MQLHSGGTVGETGPDLGINLTDWLALVTCVSLPTHAIAHQRAQDAHRPSGIVFGREELISTTRCGLRGPESSENSPLTIGES